MEFSSLFPHSGHCVWSPDGKWLATTDQGKVLVRHGETLTIHSTFSPASIDPITSLQWSPDSCYILIVHLSSRLLQVFSLSSPSFLCRLDESLYGLTSARFTPDSRHILTIAAFSLRLTIHSLLTSNSYTIRRPKPSPPHFSPDHHLLLTLERHSHLDHIGVYCTERWEQLHHFALDSGMDVCDFTVSPDSSMVACWQGVLDCGVGVWTVDGRRVMEWKGEGGQLGVGVVEWSTDGQFLVVGGYDDKVRVFVVGSWALIAEWTLEEKVKKGSGVTVYQERRVGEEEDSAVSEKENNESLSEELITDRSLGAEEVGQRKAGTVKGQPIHPSFAAAGKAGKHRSSHSISLSRPSSVTSRLPLASSTNRSIRAMSMTSNAIRKGTMSHATNTRAEPTRYVLPALPFTIPSLPSAPIVPSSSSFSSSSPLPPLPSIGVTHLSFSPSSTYLAVRSLSFPSSLFLFSLPTLTLHSLLTHLHPLDSTHWHQLSLVMTGKGGEGRVWVWREGGAGVVEVGKGGEGFGVRKVGWGEWGRVVLMDKVKACVMYMSEGKERKLEQERAERPTEEQNNPC